MFRKFLPVLLTVSIVISISTSIGIASAQTAHCTDAAYLGPIVNIFNNVLKTIDYTKPETVGNALLTEINLRIQYEETVPPTDCEALQPVVVGLLGTLEDSIYGQLSATLDKANIADYKDSVTAGAARFQGYGKTINDALGAITFGDTVNTGLPASTATPAAPQECTDSAFIDQLKKDLGALSAMSGTNLTAVIKIRYDYEDMTAPAGCEDARAVVAKSLSAAEDYVTLTLMGQADTSNAATYTKFVTDTVAPRIQSLSKLAKEAVPAMAATAAK